MRVLRALLRVLADILATTNVEDLTASKLREYVLKIDVATLSPDEVRKVQGAAGVRDLYLQMKVQVLS